MTDATNLAIPKDDALPAVTKRRWGYLVWGVAMGFIFIPELLAAWKTTEKHLPFTTISAMVGHLEYVNDLWEIAPTALIVLALYSLYRVPPPETSGGHDPGTLGERSLPHRTAGGRLTFKAGPDAEKPAEQFDNERASLIFAASALAVSVLIALGAVLADRYWSSPGPGPVDFHVGYVLYGSIALFWIAAPSAFAILAGRDAPFPTLFRTIKNLQEWLERHRGNLAGKLAAYLFPVLILWGLVFLLFHLTLYPFPNITHILNPSGQ